MAVPARDRMDKAKVRQAAASALGSVDLHQSISDRLVDLISEAISNGKLAPGQRLIEAVVAENFGVSRGPVREAFKTLASVGLLDIRKNRGAYVARPSDADFEQLIIIRSSIEGTAARLAATKIMPDDVARLKGLITDMEAEAAAHNVFAFRETDWRFHEAICIIADAHWILETWRGMRDQIRLHLHLNPNFVTSPARVVANHQHYLDAVMGGDPAQAERTTRQLILTNGYRLLSKPVPRAFADLVAEESL